jgi:endo-1,4-beta-xylanase
LTNLAHFVTAVVAATVLSGCAGRPSSPPSAATPPTLKEAFSGAFRIGAALNPGEFDERDTVAWPLIPRQFNTISPENVLKWDYVEPRPGAFDFTVSDRYVAFGERHGMMVIGHTLVWHSQTPRWVFDGVDGKPATRDTLLARMRAHINGVVGRYKGRIRGWDVVNEALNNDGTLRQSPWLRIIGEDYIAKAFQYAHEADPSAELYYNDYDLDSASKRHGAVRLVKSLLAQGIPVAGVGLQGHYKLSWPSTAEIDSTIRAFSDLGVKVAITELDVDVLPSWRNQPTDVGRSAELQRTLDPYRAGLPDSLERALARRYADIFDVYMRHRAAIDRVTFWGVTDRASWLNNYPMRGRTNYPLLFDRAGKPKPAFDAVLDVARRPSIIP